MQILESEDLLTKVWFFKKLLGLKTVHGQYSNTHESKYQLDSCVQSYVMAPVSYTHLTLPTILRV